MNGSAACQTLRSRAAPCYSRFNVEGFRIARFELEDAIFDQAFDGVVSGAIEKFQRGFRTGAMETLLQQAFRERHACAASPSTTARKALRP